MIIVPMILNAIRDEIYQKCILEMPLVDGAQNPYALSEVKVGRYYQDPQKALFRASVIHGDLEDSEYPDGIFKRTTMRRSIAMDFIDREIGGGETWLRRGTVRYELFFLGIKRDEEETREIAYTMANNIFEAVRGMSIHTVKADNEHAHNIFVVVANMLQTGGPPSSWIFRGKMYWEVQTEIF